MLILIMDAHSPETARQRATRIWRNYQIQKKYHPPQITASEPTSYDPLQRIQAIFRREMRDALARRANNKTMIHYLAIVRARKLREMENKNGK
jgi:hypothetical protein